MIRAIIAAAILATPAAADSKRVWHGPSASGASTIEIHAPTQPDSVATVTFKNTTVHSGDETFPLSWDGIDITVQFDWDADGTWAEAITITAPPGLVAIPYRLVVPEDETGTVQIKRYIGG